MPVLPAFCDNCGAVFSSGFAFEGSANVTLSGNRSGPCPVCGGMGHIPGGVFNFVGNTIEILSAPERTRRELRLLAKILEEAKSKGHSPEDVARNIEREIPSLRSIGQLLPRNRAELYGFLALILAAIQLFSQGSTTNNVSNSVNVNQVINQTIIQPPAPQEKPRPVLKEKKPGRNEPCTCGSGKKFKKCCGAG